MSHRDHSGQQQSQNSGLPSLGPELFTWVHSVSLSLFGFPPEILKPPLSHLHLKDEIGLEDPGVSEKVP